MKLHIKEKLFEKLCMKGNKKIKAFTLSEMVVVIILTSIVVGLAFSVLSLVQKHMMSIQHNFSQNTELQKLEQSLYLDLNRYSKIEYNTSDEELKFSNALDSIRYTIHKKIIIKDQDTFNISINQKQFFFNGNSIESGQIDAIKLETSKATQNKIIFVFKTNDAANYMN